MCYIGSMKRYRTLLIWFSYASLLGYFSFRHAWWWWGLGLLLSVFLTLVDRAMYVWWLRPYEQLSIQVQYWWGRKDLPAIAKLIWQRGKEQTRLAHLSAAFAILWPFLAFYLLTSTASVVALGIVMGLGLHLALAIVTEWSTPTSLKLWFCWQIKRQLTDKEVKFLGGGFILIWVLVSIKILV